MHKFFKKFFCCSVKHGENNQQINTDSNNIEFIQSYVVDIDIDENLKNKKKLSYNSLSSTYVINSSESLKQQLFDNKFIREEEQNILIFTKPTLLELINYINGLPDWDKYYEKDNLTLWTQRGSPINTEFIFGKSEYIIPKTNLRENVSLKDLIRIIYDPAERLKWDKSLRLYDIIEGDDVAHIYRIWFNSPMFLVSERDFIEKRCEFLEGDVYYNISTSVPLDVYYIHLVFSRGEECY
jgi:hypothetical protein